MWKRFLLSSLAAIGFSTVVLASPATNLTAQQDDEVTFLDREASEEIARLAELETDEHEILGLDQRGRRGRGGVGRGGFNRGNRGFYRGNRGYNRGGYNRGFYRGNRGFNRGYGYRFPGHRIINRGLRQLTRPWYNYGFYRYPAGSYPGYSYGQTYTGQWLCSGYANGVSGAIQHNYTSTDYNAAYNAAYNACANTGELACVVSCQRQ